MKTKVYVVVEYKMFSSDPPAVKIFDQGNIEGILDYTAEAFRKSALDNSLEVTNGLIEVESADMSWMDNSAEFTKAVEAAAANQVAKGIHQCKVAPQVFEGIIKRFNYDWIWKSDHNVIIDYCPFCGEKLQ